MMKKFKVLTALFIFFTFNAGAQSNSLFDYIPANARTVIHIDLLRLNSKLPAESFRQSIFYKELTKEDESPLPEIFNNLQTTGIDYSAGMLITLRSGNGDMVVRSGGVGSIFLKIKDVNSFTGFVQKRVDKKQGDNGNTTEIKTYGTDHILFSKDKMSLAWNNDVLVMSSEPEQFSWWTTINDTIIPGGAEEIRLRALADQKKRNLLFELLTPAKASNPADPRFAALMKEPADCRIWTDDSKEKIPTALSANPAAIFKMLQKFGTKNSAAILNFENGKIEMHALHYPDPSIKELYKDFKISPQNGELLRKLPPEHVMGLMSISLDQQVIKNFMRQSGLRSLVGNMQKEIPFKLNPALISSSFKSNMLLAVLKDDNMKEDDAVKKTAGLDFLLAIPISDKASFEKLKEKVLPLIDSMKKNEPAKLKGMPVVKYNDEMMVISLAPSTANSFLYNPAPGEAPAWIHEFSQYPLVMNFNFSKLFRALMKTESQKEEMDKISKIVDQVYFYGGNYNGEAIEMNMEFRFADKNVNALQQLVKLVSTIK